MADRTNAQAPLPTARPPHLRLVDQDGAAPVPPPARPSTRPTARRRAPLYTPEQRILRDESRWTLVQGLLAPLQFLVFAISLVLVLRALITGEGVDAATVSVVVKTVFLYVIMVTGAIWEKKVFGRYLFAPAFYWEDVFSMLVLALHTIFLASIFGGFLDERGQMVLALAAYASYVINATQFILKLRAARLDERDERAAAKEAEAGAAQGAVVVHLVVGSAS